MKWFKNIGVWLTLAAAAVVGFLKLRKDSKPEVKANEELLDDLRARDISAIKAEAKRRRDATNTVNPVSKPRESLADLLARIRKRRRRD